MRVLSREAGRKKSACMTGLAAAERERLAKMTSIERMTAALRMGRIVRQLAKANTDHG